MAGLRPGHPRPRRLENIAWMPGSRPGMTSLRSGRSPHRQRACSELEQSALLRLGETVVEGVAGTAHRADRILLAAEIEQLAQAADMHVHGPLVDIDVAPPDAVEQLL